MSLAYPRTARCSAGPPAARAVDAEPHRLVRHVFALHVHEDRPLDVPEVDRALGPGLRDRVVDGTEDGRCGGQVSGAGTSTGNGSWCSSQSGRWNDAIIEKIGTPRW